MFESEEDKKKKVYPRLPDVWDKKDTPYYIYTIYKSYIRLLISQSLLSCFHTSG